MKNVTFIFNLLLIILLTGCTASTAKINFDKNPSIDISQAKTFAWLNKDHILTSQDGINPILKLSIEKNIEKTLIAKGYQLVANVEQADLAVSYTVGSRDKVRVDSFPVAFQSGFGWGRPYYGNFASVNVATETRVRNYTEGKLAIDVFDVKSKQPAWHGWATKNINSNDKKNLEALVKTVVTQTLANL